MSDEIILKSTQVLTDLKAAVLAFDGRTASARLKAQSGIQEMRSWMEERKSHWLRAVERSGQRLASAEDALSSCEAGGYRDDDGDWVEPDCSGESHAVDAAGRQLESDVESLRRAEMWIRICEIAIAEFEYSAERFRALVLMRLGRATCFLDDKTAQYEELIGIARPTPQNDRSDLLPEKGKQAIIDPSKGSSQPQNPNDLRAQQTWADNHLHPKFIAHALTELEAAAGYQGEDYEAINYTLRNDDMIDPSLKQQIEALDSVIDKSVVPVDIITFRGCGYAGLPEQLIVGSMLDDKAFRSTSLVRTVAKGFTEGVLLEIMVPKGSKAFYMDGLYEDNADEVELLLPRNTRLKILGRTHIDGIWHLKAIIRIKT